MKLAVLLQDLYSISIEDDREISGLALDSRTINPGDLFLAYPGTQLDGRQFIKDAIHQGACAVLTEGTKTSAIHSIPIIAIPHLAEKISAIAARFYNYPANSLTIVGVTGTNGKTSCTHFIAQALQHLNKSCGVIGTLGSGLIGRILPGTLTTPDAITLQKTLANLLQQGAQAVAMEVSSHSLEQGRVNAIPFHVAIFTNLTQDHLDYHGTMAAYGAAKKKLFVNSLLQHAVINADDDFGKELIATLAPNQNVYAYSLDKNTRTTVPLIYADQVQLDITGMHAHVVTPWGEGEIHAPLVGQFNLSNVLAALTTLCVLKIPLADALAALAVLTPVPGRMQALGGQGKPLVVVDYSHTPDALEKALIALRHHCQGQLICLFGCGGDRDRGKRALMAAIAERYADQVMVTNDNPRTEDPEQIIADIKRGFQFPDKIKMQQDRSQAIRDVIQCAAEGDCVLVAGKGAETYQQIGHEKIPFSDVEQVQNVLLRMPPF